MKKYIAVLSLLCILSAPVSAETCAGGSGTVIYGNYVDPATGLGTRYCKSNITMNWWSAFAWCDAIGGELIDLTKECLKSTGTSACPNLAGTGSGNVWTQNVPNNQQAYGVDLGSGGIKLGNRSTSNGGVQYALCVDFQK